ncbi:MAG: phage integrase SAM-like domain-containing protein, partial [Thermoflexibacteraceae bacterium]
MYDFQITQNKAVQELPTLYYFPINRHKKELKFYGRVKLNSFRSYQFTLKLKVPREQYNPETKLFTVKAYNDYINRIKQLIKNIYREKYADEIVSDELLNSIYRDTVAFLTQKKVNSKKVNLRFNIDTLLIDYCKFISINKAKGTINNYHNSCKLINTYCKKHNIRTTNEIPDKVLDDFIICLEQEFNYKHNTIHKQLVFLKSFLKYCYENNKTSKHFGANHKSKYNTLQLPDNIKHLSKEDIIKLEKLDNLSKNEEAAKDLFLFQYHTGLSYTDTQNFDFEKDT